METSKRSSVHPVVIWACLVGLTGLSFLLSRLHLGPADAVFALLIAACKSALVLLFFMHLLEHGLRDALIPFISAGFVVLLLALLVTDVLTRHTFPRAPLPVENPVTGRPIER